MKTIDQDSWKNLDWKIKKSKDEKKVIRVKWKTIAIIFIILFVLETIVLIAAIKFGVKELRKEETCSNQICFNKGYQSYSYSNGLCSCFTDGEVLYKEVLD